MLQQEETISSGFESYIDLLVGKIVFLCESVRKPVPSRALCLAGMDKLKRYRDALEKIKREKSNLSLSF